jgi:hypothetical protein
VYNCHLHPSPVSWQTLQDNQTITEITESNNVLLTPASISSFISNTAGQADRRHGMHISVECVSQDVVPPRSIHLLLHANTAGHADRRRQKQAKIFNC